MPLLLKLKLLLTLLLTRVGWAVDLSTALNIFNPKPMPRTIDRSIPIKAKLIHPNPWNPYANKSDRLQDAIAESIGEFDQIQDVVVRPHPDTKNNKGQYQILDGEGRHRTFHGDAEIFCTVIHGLTDAQAKKITIVMDETRASADQKELNALLAELSEDFSIDELVKGLPYEEDYLAELISMGDGDFSVFDGDAYENDGAGNSGSETNNQGKPPINEDDFETSEDPEYIPRVKLGDIWRLGRHYIACGDCTVEENVEKLTDLVEPVSMVWADPPYGISIVATNGFVGGDEVNGIPFGGVKKHKGYVGGSDCRRTTIAENAAKKERLGTSNGSKPFGSSDVRGTVGATNIVKANKYFPVHGDNSIDIAVASFSLYRGLFEKATHCWWGGNHYCEVLPSTPCWIVWDKENTGDFADAELAWCSEKSAVRIFKHMWNGMVKASEHGQRRVHPTQKPIALAAWFFEKYGKASDVIADPFLGSGMSLMAAEQMGDRRVIGFELSNHYCSLICDRWEKLTSLKAEKIGDLPDFYQKRA